MNKTLRVLHIEDQEQDAAMIRRHLLQLGYDVISERVETPEGTRAALETQEWDVILCDYSMPCFSALTALALLRETELDLPFIIVSGTIGEELAVEALLAGAHDYLPKDNLVRLAPAIEREVEEVRSRLARKQAEESLKTSEAELRALFAAMNDVIFVLDFEGRYLKIAPTDPTYLYKPSTDLINKTVHEVFPEEDAVFFLEHINHALKEGQMHRVEYHLQLDEAEIWFEGSVSPLTKDSVIWVARDITERKQAEEKLRQSEHQLAEAQHLARIGSWNWDLQNNTLTWSEEHYHIFGVDPQKFNLAYEPMVAEFVHPDDRDLVKETVENALKTQESFGFDYRIIRRDGSERIVHCRGNFVSDNQEKPTRMYGTVQDVTERRQADEEQERLTTQLESQRQRINNIVSSVPGIVWEAWGGPDTAMPRTDFVSDYVKTLLGYSVEEWLSTPNFWLSIVHPDDRELAAQTAAAYFSKGEKGTMQFRWVSKSGQAVWVESNFAVIKDDEDRPVGLRGVTIDITERKQAENLQLRRAANAALRADISAALAESDGSFQSMLENCSKAMVQHLDAAFALIWTLNEEENVLELQASAGMYAHKSGPYARVPVGVFKIGLVAREQQPHISNDLMNDPDARDKEWIRCEGMIAFAGYPLIIENRLMGVMAIFARHRLAEDTIDALASVADVISQGIDRKRTKEALRQSEERLRQSQKLESIGQLAGGIAHDFNNLLTAITGYSELSLRKLRSDDPLRRNLEEIKKAGDRAAALTRQLLAFSRKQVLQPKILDLNSVVLDFEKMLQRLIGEDIELRTVLEPEIGSLKADPGQIEQVIMNLVVNARDAMPQGGKLTIETKNVFLDENYARQRAVVIPGSYIMLAVSDTGTGIDQETQKRIFEPFFTTKAMDQGTGLGLATVYGIIKQSGGYIWVYSEMGQGSSFKIYLPRVDDDMPDCKRSDDEQKTVQGTETILLAEDEEVVRMFTRELLESYGYRVLEAANGGAALSICERHRERIDLLITDVIMPEMSGRDLAENVSRLRPEVKVLYMSGYTDDAIVNHGVLDEGINFIQKPFAPDTFGQAVKRVLNKR